MANEKPVPQPKPKTQSVRALTTIHYGGTVIEAGDAFDIRTPDVAQLLEVNAVELLEAPAAA